MMIILHSKPLETLLSTPNTQILGVRGQGNLTLNIYDSNFDIEKTGHLEISESKYSEYKIQEAGIVQITTSYDDNYLIDDLISLKVNSSKYSDFTHDNVDSFFEIVESYDDNVKVQ